MKRPGFDEWYAGHAQKMGMNPNPDDPLHYYDYRKAYQSGAEPDKSGHWPSEFKTEDHPNLVIPEDFGHDLNTKTGERISRKSDMGKVKRHDNYKYDLKYEASEEQKHRRAERNKDRRQALREGRVKKGDKMDVHHIESIHGPVKVVNRSRNRSVR